METIFLPSQQLALMTELNDLQKGLWFIHQNGKIVGHRIWPPHFMVCLALRVVSEAGHSHSVSRAMKPDTKDCCKACWLKTRVHGCSL